MVSEQNAIELEEYFLVYNTKEIVKLELKYYLTKNAD